MLDEVRSIYCAVAFRKTPSRGEPVRLGNTGSPLARHQVTVPRGSVKRWASDGHSGDYNRNHFRIWATWITSISGIIVGIRPGGTRKEPLFLFNRNDAAPGGVSAVVPSVEGLGEPVRSPVLATRRRSPRGGISCQRRGARGERLALGGS